MTPHFADLRFGEDDAKSDRRLADYFIRIPEYELVRTGEAMIVVGRKGTGKSAICEMLSDSARGEPGVFAANLSFKDSPSAVMFEATDERFTGSSQYISIWKFVIALETAKLVLEDNSVPSPEREGLERFLRENFGAPGTHYLDAVSTLKDQGWSLRFPDILPHLGGTGISKTAKTTESRQLHFGLAAKELLERLRGLPTRNVFYLLFDQLDEDYGRLPRYLDLLMSLLKAAYQVRQEMQTGKMKLRPVIVIREDVHSHLKDADLNKLSAYTVRLRWKKHFTGPDQPSLRGLVLERIRSSLGEPPGRSWGDLNALWPAVVDEMKWKGPTATAWDYLVNKTMLRPRDIIQALKRCQPYETGAKLTPTAINGASVSYAEWLYNEIGDEMGTDLNEWREALGLLGQVGGQFTLRTWEAGFSKHAVLNEKHKPLDVLQKLYEYGAIGMVGPRFWTFKFSDPQLLFDKTAAFGVHWGLRPYLSISGGIPILFES